MVTVIIAHDDVAVYIRTFDDHEEGIAHGAELQEYITEDGQIIISTDEQIIRRFKITLRERTKTLRKKSHYIV